jgi:nucleoside-diphosphate-sugar epimerase
MTILVTGATGFIGSRLCLALAEKGETVKALCRNDDYPQHKNIIPVRGDITDTESLAKAMKNCEQVYHTAALAKLWCRNQQQFHEVNVTGTRNVLEAALAAGVRKIVHTSSCGVIGPTHRFPMNENDPRITGFPIDYERTKYLAELQVAEYVKRGMNIVIVCPSRVYGEGPVTGSNTVGKMVRGYLRGNWRIIPGTGRQVANYAYLGDVVQGHIAAMEKGVAGNKYILGGEDVSFNAFFSEVKVASGKELKMFHLSGKLIRYYSHLEKIKTDLTGLPPKILPAIAERLNYDQKYSSDKAERELGYNITPFKTGIQKTVDWFRNNEDGTICHGDRCQ